MVPLAPPQRQLTCTTCGVDALAACVLLAQNEQRKEKEARLGASLAELNGSGLKRPWSAEEDVALLAAINKCAAIVSTRHHKCVRLWQAS